MWRSEEPKEESEPPRRRDTEDRWYFYPISASLRLCVSAVGIKSFRILCELSAFARDLFPASIMYHPCINNILNNSCLLLTTAYNSSPAVVRQVRKRCTLFGILSQHAMMSL